MTGKLSCLSLCIEQRLICTELGKKPSNNWKEALGTWDKPLLHWNRRGIKCMLVLLWQKSNLFCATGVEEGLGDAYISFFQYNFCFHVFQVITKLWGRWWKADLVLEPLLVFISYLMDPKTHPLPHSAMGKDTHYARLLRKAKQVFLLYLFSSSAA